MFIRDFVRKLFTVGYVKRKLFSFETGKSESAVDGHAGTLVGHFYTFDFYLFFFAFVMIILSPLTPKTGPKLRFFVIKGKITQ